MSKSTSANPETHVLVVRKTDKSIHQVPLANEATLRALSNRLPATLRWTFEVLTKEEAKKLPAFDRDYVSAGEASTKVKTLQKDVAQKDDLIAQLKAQLAELQTKGNTDAGAAGTVVKNPLGVGAGNLKSVPAAGDQGGGAKSDKKPLAADLIAGINAAETVDAVNEILGTDKRATVVEAAEARIAAINAAAGDQGGGADETI